MKEKINSVFDELQGLDIKGTPNNTSILSYVYQTLREIYNELGGSDNAGNGESGNAVDISRRDNA
jgi:hypothetical protein